MAQVSAQVSLEAVARSVGGIGALANIFRGRGSGRSRIGEFSTGAVLMTEVEGDQTRKCFLEGGPEAVEDSRQKIEAMLRGEQVNHILTL